MFNGPYLVSAASVDPYVIICNVAKKYEAGTSAYLTQLNSQYASGVGTQTFPLTMAYVTNAANQKQLLTGGSSCVSFFDNVEVPLAADLTNDGVKVTDRKQAVLQAVITNFPQMAAYLH